MTDSDLDLIVDELGLDLMVEALAMAASRHEAMAKTQWPSASARRHDETAAAMRLLRIRLISKRMEEMGKPPMRQIDYSCVMIRK